MTGRFVRSRRSQLFHTQTIEKSCPPKVNLRKKSSSCSLFQVQSDFHHWTSSKSIRNTNAIESTRNTLILGSAAETQLSIRSILFKVNKALLLSLIRNNQVKWGDLTEPISEHKCDGIKDCEDGTDERDCSQTVQQDPATTKRTTTKRKSLNIFITLFCLQGLHFMPESCASFLRLKKKLFKDQQQQKEQQQSEQLSKLRNWQQRD